ncbi:uncharacterized protein LOC104433483 isoform X2 [Eucalyptus grandis]|uniref:uncharacterized protein LOC104433483 isoform X2 n=1 Tax=Eucalyptus grandis TaxID=71139 RepID=UPI00192E9FA1|nr:uncharacterized protein LOC104433483 isoform X2 [Eucalyptus grandis]
MHITPLIVEVSTALFHSVGHRTKQTALIRFTKPNHTMFFLVTFTPSYFSMQAELLTSFGFIGKLCSKPDSVFLLSAFLPPQQKRVPLKSMAALQELVLLYAEEVDETDVQGFGCMLELLAEPFYILSQNLLLLKLRLLVETAATFLRCLTMCILIVKQTNMEKGIVFALSQVAYGACFFFGYWGFYLFSSSFKSSDLFPFRR